MTRVDFVPTPDPLLREPVLAHAVSIPVLGIDTRFETNSASVLALVVEAFGSWRAVVDAPTEATTVRIVVHDHREDVSIAARYISTPDGRLLVHTPGSIAVVDPLRRESIAYVTTDLAVERSLFQRTVVEAITFALLAAFDRHPVHAAAVVRNQHALLLAAPSGTGKSALAYLAHTAGLHVLTDDRVWVQLHPQLRVWGSATSVALRPDVAAQFPGAVISAERNGGKQVATLDSREPTHAPFAERATVCVLARGGNAALEPLGPDETARELTAQLAPGFDRFPERQDAVVRALTAQGGWRLTLSANPHDALPFLLQMLDDA